MLAALQESPDAQPKPVSAPAYPLEVLRAENAAAGKVAGALDAAVARGQWDATAPGIAIRARAEMRPAEFGFGGWAKV